jgi:riboflavin transporter FmnP
VYSLKRENWSTKIMVKISSLAVISMILMFLDLSVWFAPPFLKLDLADLPALIGAFAMGPMAGVIVQLVKNLLHLLVQGSSTGGVGEISNFIVGSAFVYTAGLFYYRDKNFKTAIIGSIVGVIIMTIIASISNYYVVFPLYAKVYGMPMEALIDMGSVLNKNIVDLKTMIIFAIVPFNILKGSIVAILSILIYKRVSPILHK